MDRLDESSFPEKKPQHLLTRTDLVELLRAIKGLLDDMEYVTVPVFKSVTSRMISAFALGRGMAPPITDDIAERVRAFAHRSKSSEAVWFSNWMKKADKARSEKKRTKGKIEEDLLDLIFPRLALPMEDFGYCLVSEKGSEIALVTLGGFFWVAGDVDHLEKLGLTVLEVAAEIRRSKTITTTQNTPIPDDYSETATDDWQDQIVADAWLKPPGDEGK